MRKEEEICNGKRKMGEKNTKKNGKKKERNLDSFDREVAVKHEKQKPLSNFSFSRKTCFLICKA